MRHVNLDKYIVALQSGSKPWLGDELRAIETMLEAKIVDYEDRLRQSQQKVTSMIQAANDRI